MHEWGEFRLLGFRASGEEIPQRAIRKRQQSIELTQIFVRQLGASRVDEARQDEVVLEHAAPAAPSQSIELHLRHCASGAPGLYANATLESGGITRVDLD